MITRQKKFKIYRESIYTVTKGKVSVVTHGEFNRFLSRNVIVFNSKLVNPQDITRSRWEIDQFLSITFSCWQGFSQRRKILLCVTEAMTNVIKHAGVGEVRLSLAESSLVFFILDKGQGLELEQLPLVFLSKGFTTKGSLGMGFMLMYQYIDRLVICTTRKGTQLALETQISFNLTAGDENAVNSSGKSPNWNDHGQKHLWGKRPGLITPRD